MTKEIYKSGNQMKIFTTILLIAFTIHLTKGQDIIHFTDGRIIEAKVISMGYDKVKFYDKNFIDGPLFTMADSNIVNIEFNNKGTLTLYEDASYSDIYTFFPKNLVSFQPTDLTVERFTVSYERLLSKGKMGIKIPLTISVNARRNDRSYTKNNFLTGVGLNIYPAGQRRLAYYFGPEALAGMRTINKEVGYEYDGNGYQEEYVKSSFLIFHFLVNQGLIYYPHKNFSISGNLGLGLRNYSRYSSRRYDSMQFSTLVVSSLNITYRF